MLAYFDTGVLLKIYIRESNSEMAYTLIYEVPEPLVFTHLHGVELPTAIRLKRFRREITLEQEGEALRNLKADLLSGHLQRPEYDLHALFQRAERLSARHAATLGARSLDILHVAAALETGCTRFISLDLRQRRLAQAEDLEILPAGLG